MLRIVDWSTIFETAHSRKVKGGLAWVRIPTRMGIGYVNLIDHDHGAAHLGAWTANRRIRRRAVHARHAAAFERP